ncbi:muconolactone Delta-isomerase family protein [Nocardioides convexus]|uniref:muconolactone Delta-isomerase family protein n=1 Tax=Nocardioides convexus TaxID=2712224 RepID=UPI0031013849
MQRGGEWAHLWRIVGQYANISVFDVESNARLHEILSNLPLFAYMRIEVTALTGHPSAI